MSLMFRMKAVGLFCGAFLLMSIGVAVAGDGSGPGAYDSFPLWKDVPGRSFATLGDGNSKTALAGVFTHRVSDGGSGPTRTPA